MRVLITGGSGLLGKYLYLTKPNSVELSSTWYTNHAEHVQYHLNISNKSQLAYILDLVKPDVIIHCAAVGSVDYAEQAYREVRQVNVGGIENLLWAISNTSIKLVYISTNAVYDGINPPYNENSIRHPANVYGRIKLDAENKVMHSNLSNNWLI
jgi:dTDP-4-dehydrorhamnose reductase